MDESTRQATRLWTLAQPRVSAFVTAVVRDFRDRDDVLQDIAVAVIESFDTYDPDRPFVAWALGVARNQVGVYLRKRRRERLVFSEATMASLEDAFSSMEREPFQLDYLQECMQHLSGRGRQICELRYAQEMKPNAISEAIGIAGTAVRKSLQRIRSQLRDCVQRKMSAEGV